MADLHTSGCAPLNSWHPQEALECLGIKLLKFLLLSPHSKIVQSFAWPVNGVRTWLPYIWLRSSDSQHALKSSPLVPVAEPSQPAPGQTELKVVLSLQGNLNNVPSCLILHCQAGPLEN